MKVLSFDLPVPEAVEGADPVKALEPAIEAFKANGSLAELLAAIQKVASTSNPFSSKNVLRNILNTPGKGMKFEQIRQRLDMIDKIKSADKTVLLEAEEHKELMRALDDMDGSWGAVNADLVATVDAVRAAKKVDVKPVEAAETKAA